MKGRLALLALFAAMPRIAGADGGLIVNPVIIDTTIKRSGQALQPITVENSGGQTLDLSIEFGPLGHDRNGTPSTPPTTYKWSAHTMLSAKPSQLTLGPGQKQSLEVTVKIPARAGGAYAFMYVLAKPRAKPGEPVTSYLRVAVVIELVLPGTAKHRIAPGKVYATQDAAGGPITLHASAQNLGEVHDRVGGIVLVSDDKDRPMGKLNLEPASVLPGMRRDLKATWKDGKMLAKGKYKLTATLVAPSAGGSQTALGTLVVIRPGEAARDAVIVNQLITAPAEEKTPIRLTAVVTNHGNVPLSPAGTVSFLDSEGNVVATAVLASGHGIAVNAKGSLTGTLAAGLPTGTYTARLEVMDAADQVLASLTQIQQVIAKHVKLAARISRLTPPSPKVPFVVVELTNDGSAEADCEGVLGVVDPGGNLVAELPLESQHTAVGGKAAYQRAWPAGLEPGLYDLRATLRCGGSAPATLDVMYYYSKAQR